MNISTLRDWFKTLTPREQRVLLAGTAALVLMMAVYIGLSYSRSLAQLEKTTVELRAAKHDMQKSALEVAQLRDVLRVSGKIATGQSLLTLVDQTGRQGGLGSALKRVEPEGQATVRVWIEQASFDDMIGWLDDLQRRYGVTVAQLNVDKRDMPGRVDARITLEKAGS